MGMNKESNRVDNFMSAIKNNKIFAIIILCSIVLISFGALTDAIDKVIKFSQLFIPQIIDSKKTIEKSTERMPTPLLDIELARVKPSPPFEHLKPDFAYDMILHNKSDVPFHDIVIRMDVLANKNRQKLAVTGTSARDLKPFSTRINVLGAGESKVFHKEHSPSYGYMKLSVTYWNNKVWYRCDFEGDRNGINLKGCEPINKKLSIP